MIEGQDLYEHGIALLKTVVQQKNEGINLKTESKEFKELGEVLKKLSYLKDESFCHKLSQAVITENKKYLPTKKEPTKKVELKSEETKEKKYKTRLFLGEGNFSYTRSLIEKHKNMTGLPKAIIATEYESEYVLMKEEVVKKNLDYIKEKKNGIEIRFGVDATSLESSFPGQKFKRIHFNCPLVRGSSYDTAHTVNSFFQSAENMQDKGDRIHMALIDMKLNKNYQIKIYDIVNASSSAGYELIKKRKFGTKRYPSYIHRSTTGNNPSVFAHYSKEFIFQKTEKKREEIIADREKNGTLKLDAKGKYFSNYHEEYIESVGSAFVVTTDDDSSSYEDNSPSFKK